MQLFNTKTIKRHLSEAHIPEAHLNPLNDWAEMIRSNRIFSLKETALHGQFTSTIVEGVLGYRGPVAGDTYTVSTQQSILGGSVDLALGKFGDGRPQIIAPLELKGAKTRDLDAIMPGRNKSPVQQAWEYAMHAPGVKWVLVCNYVELRMYGFGEGTTAYEVFQLDRLTEPDEYARFMMLLSADNLLSGRVADLLKESQREDKDITDSLYNDYKKLRLELLAGIQEADPSLPGLEAISLAQKVLDRILFVAFAEDTGLLPQNTLESAYEARDPYNPRPVWDNFSGLFRAIDKGSEALKIPRYNGGLFREDTAIDSLTLSDEICEGFKVLGSYDFASEVPVTVLGHIFEQSIADVERLQAIARGEEQEPEKSSGTNGRRKRDGVVYTPDYIARFIVTETLGVHLKEIFSGILRDFATKGSDLSDYASIKWRAKANGELNAWKAYRERLRTLRIVDPACGSGVFLIMALDFMREELTRVNEKIKDLSPKTEHFGDLLSYVPDSEILTNNLFGVDVNEESIEITKLSLWIKTARRGKVLDSLSGSIRVGDSLIEDSNFAYLDHAFTWETAFSKVFTEGGFDVVLGNPPYVRMEFLKKLKPYLESRYEVVSDRADLYCYFYERGLRLLKPGGRLGYISSNTFFKTGSGRPLREYLLREATVESVVDFGDLQVFEGVTTYPAILTMRKEKPAKDHEVQFWQVDSLPENNFQATWESAAGPYPQSALGSGSWEFENTALRALRDKIRTGRPALKDVYGAPLYGIKTGLNGAFVIDTPTKEALCSQDPRSAELLKPFLEGKDLKRWRAQPRGMWLIYIPKNRICIDDYPAIRDWLLPFKERLEKRATKQEWFELQQAQEAYAPHFCETKITYRDIAAESSFFRDTSGSYLETTAFALPSDDFATVGLLNSRVMWFFVRSLTTLASGGYFRMKARYISQLPIPEIDTENRERLRELSEKAHRLAESRLKLQTAFTRRIPDLCPPERVAKLTNKLKEWWSFPGFAEFRAEAKKVFKADIPLSERSDWEDWLTRDRAEINRLTTEIAQTEAKIDAIVYDLFDLTPEEISLLETAVNG